MYHLQIITREADDVQAAVVAAIREGRTVSFEIEGVRGGLRLRHKKFKGDVRFLKTPGPFMITVRGADEWKLLDAFIGRLVYHFAGSIRGINIQLDAPPPSPKKRARRVARKKSRRPARAKRAAKGPARRTPKRTIRRTPKRATRRTGRRLTRRTARRGRTPRRSR
jgi:hypothetical protein